MATQRAYEREDKEKRRQAIIDAAAELLDMEASGLPSVDSIAERANLAKGTIYLYFKFKEEIFTK